MTVAVGFFDGVHLGHQAILHGSGLALTFKAHPLSLLAPERAPQLIMSWRQRERAIRALGIPRVCALDFDDALAASPPMRFIDLLRDLVAPETLSIRCGANWRFGRNGAGDPAWLRANGVDVTVVPYAEFDGAPVSSTRIREALAAGQVGQANAMMGRTLAVSGRVVAGKGLGRRLGFPTLNVVPDWPSLLPFGVYAVDFEGVVAVANYGLAPTLGDLAWKEPVWEIHVLSGGIPDIVANAVEFTVSRFVRPERKFVTIEALQAQIAADCREVLAR